MDNFISNKLWSSALISFFVEIEERCSALLELSHVLAFKAYSGIVFTNFNKKIISDVLDNKVLSNGSELLLNVGIIYCLFVPFCEKQIERLFEDIKGPHLTCIWHLS